MRCSTLTELPPPGKACTELGRSAGWPFDRAQDKPWTEEGLQSERNQVFGKNLVSETPWPRVSIVTPSYNQGQFIEETIRSVLLQGYPDLEYIIIDGGSTDGSVEIIRKYEPWLAYWVSEKDKGQAEAINKGFRRARGDIVAWLNSDDTYLPGTVSAAVAAFEAEPDMDLLFGDCNIMDEYGRVRELIHTTKFDLPGLLRTNLIPQPATFFRRRVLDSVGFLDPGFHYAMDYEFWLRIARRHRIQHIPTVLANFRMYSNSKSVSQLDGFYDELVTIFERAAQDPQMARYLPPSPSQREGLAHYNIGVAYYGRGQMKMARQHLLQAARLYPALLIQSGLPIFLAKSLLGARLTGAIRRWRNVDSR